MGRTILTLLMIVLVPPAAHAQSSWVKLCEKSNAVTKDKDGKDVKKEVIICLTHHERLGEKGNVLVSAALRQIEGRDKHHFMVMVPLGELIKPGMRATIYPKDLWESVETKEGISDSNHIRDMRVYIGRWAHLVTATAMPTAITWLASTWRVFSEQRIDRGFNTGAICQWQRMLQGTLDLN